MIQLFLEKILEAVFFAVFLLIGKNIKEKRIRFVFIMILEYLLLKHFIKFSVNFQIAYTFMSYVNLKVLYKEKTQITDIFLFTSGSLILILVSLISYAIVYFTFRQYLIALILNRILLFLVLILFKNKIRKLYKEFYSLWNRHNFPNKIKSLTLRNISIIAFNLMFWFINLGMLIALKYK